jgi:hypothetical protein
MPVFWIAMLALALAGSTAAHAQNDPFEFLTLDCVFTTNVVTRFDHGKLETRNDSSELRTTYSGFDAKGGKAIAVGNAGTDSLFYIPGDRKIMLVGITTTGNGTMTSISQPQDGVAVAFHSRHMWLNGQPIVSHYYTGRCRVRS